jgi:hypothetical protein
MGGQENIVLNDRVMPDVVAAPQRDVGANLRKGLDSIVFEDEAVFFYLQPGKCGCPAADIGNEGISLESCGGNLRGSYIIDPRVADGDKQAEAFWRERLGYSLEGYHRASAKFPVLEISSVYAKARDLEV